MASKGRRRSFTTPAVAPPVPAHVLPSVPGLLVSPQPAQFQPVTHQLGQGSVWQGVPGALGQLVQLPQGVQLCQGVQPAQLPQGEQLLHGLQLPQPVHPVQLPQGLDLVPGVQQVPLPQGLQLQPGVQLLQVPQGLQMSQGVQQVQLPQGVQLVQLPQGVQLPPAPAACPPSYPWGQQVLTGTSLVPQQPMGLGPWAGFQGQPLYPTGCSLLPVAPKHCGPAAHRAQGPAVPHTLPGSAQQPAEASGRDRVAVEPGVPTASPHQLALAAPADTTTGEPTGAVTTPAALGSPVDLPQQGPAACTEGIPKPAKNTAANDVSAWLDAMDLGDAIPDAPDSPDVAAFLRELPDLSEAQDTSPRERGPVALGLQDGEVTSPVPSSPAFLSRLPDLSDLLEIDGFWEPAAEITHPQEQVVLSPLGDSGDTGCSTHGTSVTNEVYDELPKAEGGCTEEPAAAEPLLDGATELPPCLQRSPLQSPEQSPQEPAEDSPLASPCRDPQPEELKWPWLSPLRIPLLSPLSSPPPAPQTEELQWPWLSPLRIPLLSPLSSPPPAPQPEDLKWPWLSPLRIPLLSPLPSPPPAPQPQPPSTAQLMEELLPRLPLTPGTSCCWGLPGPGAAGATNTKRLAPARDTQGQETSLLDEIPPKRSRR